MAVTVAQYEAHLETARVAAAASDWAGVLTAVGAARACLAALPDSQDASARVAYRPDILDRLEDQARRALTASSAVGRVGGPVQYTKIRYKRISS